MFVNRSIYSGRSLISTLLNSVLFNSLKDSYTFPVISFSKVCGCKIGVIGLNDV